MGEENRLGHAARSASDVTTGNVLPPPFDRLTPLEIRTLLLVFERNTAKDIARIEGVTPDAIVARINRARNKLGGITRIAAARNLMAALPTDAYHSMIPHPLGISENASFDQVHLASSQEDAIRQAPSSIWQMPLPTKQRPVNDDPLIARIIWPIVVAVLIVVMMAILQAVMVGLDRLSN